MRQPLQSDGLFQLTAARRRLGAAGKLAHIKPTIVSTHSRPKAAGFSAPVMLPPLPVSTHSRPKAAGLPLLLQIFAP